MFGLEPLPTGGGQIEVQEPMSNGSSAAWILPPSSKPLQVPASEQTLNVTVEAIGPAAVEDPAGKYDPVVAFANGMDVRSRIAVANTRYLLFIFSGQSRASEVFMHCYHGGPTHSLGVSLPRKYENPMPARSPLPGAAPAPAAPPPWGTPGRRAGLGTARAGLPRRGRLQVRGPAPQAGGSTCSSCA